MKLENSLYTIESRDGNSFRIALDAGCFIYRAHFPGQPVTPGVCIVQTAVELAGILTGKPMELATLVNAKFLGVVDPRLTPCVVYTFDNPVHGDGKAGVKVTVSNCTDGRPLAKLSLRLRECTA